MEPARRGPWIVAIVAGLFVWLTGVLGDYGWFTDELYFLACSKRPALGYVDQPPFAPLFLGVIRGISESLWLVRLVPAAAFGATVLVTARLARQLGGGATAQTIAALLVGTSPAFLVIASFYSMNPFELLLVALLAQVLLELADGAEPRRWLAVGVIVGIAVLNKHTIVVPGTLLVLATLLSPARAHLRTRWPYLGLVLALGIAGPHLLWLVQHDLVTFEFYRVSTEAKNVETSAVDALLGQLLFAGPVGFPVAALGSVWLARRRGTPANLRGFAAVFVVAVVMMMVAGVSRPDRIAGVYPLAFAAGACAFARLTEGRRWVRRVAGAAFAFSVIAPVPLLLPVLPPDELARYAAELEMTPQLEKQKPGTMPQWLADRLGWRELAEQTAAVVRTLDPADRGRTVLFGEHYGIAGALELYGPELGLPPLVASPHNAFWTWGPYDAPILVGIGGDVETIRRAYGELTEVARVRCEHCYQDGLPIWIARGPGDSLARVWPELRLFR